MSDRANAVVKVKVEILDPDDRLFPELAAKVSLPAQRVGQRTRTRTALFSSCPNRPCSRKTGTISSGSSAKTILFASVRSRWYRRPTTAARVESGLKLNDAVVLEPDENSARIRRWFESTSLIGTAHRPGKVHGQWPKCPRSSCAVFDKEYRRDEFRIPVLVNLDVAVGEGEFLALMGPSGSGKTTLLNLIAGLDRATSGKVIVHGQDLGELSEAEITRWRANNVGFIFQTYNLIPVLTAFENVELPLLLTHLSRRKRRENVMTALRIVGLAGREHHYPRQLSGGQEQRVAIARAIITDPYLLVADEPTGDLDRTTGGEILELLEQLNREFQKTIVMVTHDPLAAQRATRTLHLDKGRLVDETVPDSPISAAS